ncbi:MAG: uracil-DNA glycosylase [Actinobacteria bacterium]|nr:uracil-DNA glycosylase [Actinomycetota bacterium]
MDRKTAFRSLVSNVRKCTSCHRMSGRLKVLGNLNGSLFSNVLFLGEAPGRLGADRYGIPFWGDQSARNFDTLVHAVGWTRAEIFITNALLCNPRNDEDRNDSPETGEIRNCSSFLLETLNIVRPRVIAPLGKVALQTLESILACRIDLRTSVAQPVQCQGYVIFPLYHPGPRALVHRSFNKQLLDYYSLKTYVQGFGRPSELCQGLLQLSRFTWWEHTFRPTKYQRLIGWVVRKAGTVSESALAKITYLLDWSCYSMTGSALSDALYVRDKNGISAASLAVDLATLRRLGAIALKGSSIENGPSRYDLSPVKGSFGGHVERFTLQLLAMGDAELVSLVHRTPPVQRQAEFGPMVFEQ